MCLQKTISLRTLHYFVSLFRSRPSYFFEAWHQVSFIALRLRERSMVVDLRLFCDNTEDSKAVHRDSESHFRPDNGDSYSNKCSKSKWIWPQCWPLALHLKFCVHFAAAFESRAEVHSRRKLRRRKQTACCLNFLKLGQKFYNAINSNIILHSFI